MVLASEPKTMSLEAFLHNPPERVEWVDERLVEKAEMTAKAGRIHGSFFQQADG